MRWLKRLGVRTAIYVVGFAICVSIALATLVVHLIAGIIAVDNTALYYIAVPTIAAFAVYEQRKTDVRTRRLSPRWEYVVKWGVPAATFAILVAVNACALEYVDVMNDSVSIVLMFAGPSLTGICFGISACSLLERRFFNDYEK